MDDYSLDSYFYELPQELIPQQPPAERGASRLMILTRSGTAPPRHALFNNLIENLPKDALLVANNSRVLPARLLGARPQGGKAEFLLLTPLPLVDSGNNAALVNGLIRPAAKIRIGDTLNFGQVKAEILEKRDFGKCLARLSWQGELEKALLRAGTLPLPPYIRRAPCPDDFERYQTLYASQPGSIAAPTAGLHFTEAMRRALTKAGIEWQEVSLHVGYGTFSPVRASDIRAHEMHSEYAVIDPAAADKIQQAKREGRPVIAIGTTSARTLEGVFMKVGEVGPFAGMINLFLYPGREFHVIDGLLTNFHLPKSSLLMLVSAFAGRNRIMEAYSEAVKTGYRFFSYGDAMLITPGDQ
ncbi:MAG: tRNA preQ1(34) S-adenosylmethionine ribosyltransferase-isomerase QueA [Desulfovibrio sp.]|nr:tRNA preQ1(34) S-adenosylmethionine ribosyltransferase-isomerase QueA [Desulfovibrio sp.]